MNRLKIFLSYNSSDKLIAGNIKRQLEAYGVKVFLAHQDIKPTEEWHDRILAELENADVFLPLLTDDFEKSKWTGQECGYAVAKRAFIISLKVTKDPPAFLSRKQAFKLRQSNLPGSCRAIAKIVNNDARLRRRFLDGLIEAISNSESFEDAKQKTSWLDEFEGYTRSQVNQVLRASVDNNQIWHSFGAQRNIDAFIHKYKTIADRRIVTKWRSLTR